MFEKYIFELMISGILFRFFMEKFMTKMWRIIADLL